MKKLNDLSELQIINMYQKNNDQKLLNYIDERIEKLHKSKQNPNKFNNEQLVLLIKKYNDDIYWTELYKKTKNSIHYCIYKYASDFYKKDYTGSSEDKENSEIFSVMRMGWYKAVNTYNIAKGKEGFVAYATTIMFQYYVRYTQRNNNKRLGKSVYYINVESVYAKNDTEQNTDKNKMIDSVYEDKRKNSIEVIEAKIYLKDKLKLLKEYDPVTYEIVMLYYYERLTQVGIAEKLSTKDKKRTKTWVGRQLKKGRNFLMARIPEEEYKSIIKDLDK